MGKPRETQSILQEPKVLQLVTKVLTGRARIPATPHCCRVILCPVFGACQIQGSVLAGRCGDMSKGWVGPAVVGKWDYTASGKRNARPWT